MNMAMMKRFCAALSILIMLTMLTGMVSVFAEENAAQEWTCGTCGETATGNFCSNCGAAKPEEKADADSESAGTALSNDVPQAPVGTTYTYLHDKWDLYFATLISDTTIKIENYGRFDAGANGDPFKYEYDVSIISTEDSSIDFHWLDDSHTSFSLTMHDEENYYWDEPCMVGFVANDSIGESSVNDDKPIFTFRHDKWDLYVAVQVSDTAIKVENWGRFDAGAGGDPFVYEYDVKLIDTSSENDGFRWLDDSHSSFSLSMQDKDNSYWDESRVASFALNPDFLNSSADESKTVFTYLNDKWDLYVGVLLSDSTIKIENWSRFDAGDDGDPFRYEYDVATFGVGASDDFGFSWMDDGHAAFSVTMQDSENSYWDTTSPVSFAICPNFADMYIKPAQDYENAQAASEDSGEAESDEGSEEEANAVDDETPNNDSATEGTEPLDAEKIENGTEGELLSERDLTYELKDGKLTLIRYDGTGDTVSIPSDVDGYDVVAIGDSVFENCTKLQTVINWADIEVVGDSAFKGCTGITSISFPNETMTIGAHAFEGCTSLETVILWGDPSIEEYAFKGCTALTSISFSSDTDHVGPYAFEGCTALETVIIWGIKTIDEYAFAGCTSISSMSFPNDVEIIGDHAFDGCSNLESVIVWGKNTVIGSDAFANCPKLSRVPS